MLDHSSSCQTGVNPESNVHIELDTEMHCVCGFSNCDGNSMARHLATCDHKSAYPSVESAQENTVKRNMLDMLGLMRRPGESDDITSGNPEEQTNESDVQMSEPSKAEGSTVEGQQSIFESSSDTGQIAENPSLQEDSTAVSENVKENPSDVACPPEMSGTTEFQVQSEGTTEFGSLQIEPMETT